MNGFFSYLRQGLSRRRRKDRIGGEAATGGLGSNLKNLLPYVQRHWRKGGLGAFLVVITTSLSFPQPLIMRHLIDDVILGQQLGRLAGVIVLFIAVALAERLMDLFQQFYFARFEREVILDIQRDLLERALRFPKSFFDKSQTGYLMSRLSSDVQGLSWFFSGHIVYAVENLLRFMGGVILLFYLEWRMALAVLAIVPSLLFFVRYFSDRIHDLSHEGMEQRADVSGAFQEVLSSIPLIRAFSSEGKIIEQMMVRLRGALTVSLEQSAVGSLANLSIGLIPGISRAFVLALGAYWVIKGQWTLGSLLAFQAYLGYVFGPAHFLATANLQLQNSRAALERVSALFEIVLEEDTGKGMPVERLQGDIEFRHVSFSYDEREPVIADVSFHIRPGEQVAVIGPSGVGKTTLLSLILRFYKPQKGDILFDGRSAAVYDVGSLRRRLGYVSQSSLLLAGTIRENIRFGNPDATHEDIILASQKAGIHDTISGLPAGYETDVGEGGVRLSEGQKQRLSLARALIRDPDILILDEPASALDSRTERAIFQNLSALGQRKTLFIVTHRFSLARDADRILLLDENRLIATGTHRFLLETSEYYRSLLSCQMDPDG